MSSKYSPLESFYKSLPPVQREIKLSFERIESIIQSKLPASANELSWWEHETEGNHVNKRAWSNAGWRVEAVRVRGKSRQRTLTRIHGQERTWACWRNCAVE